MSYSHFHKEVLKILPKMLVVWLKLYPSNFPLPNLVYKHPSPQKLESPSRRTYCPVSDYEKKRHMYYEGRVR